MSDDPRVCRHGWLRRQCEPCDLGDDLAQAEKDKAEMLEMLRELEALGGFCESCGGEALPYGETEGGLHHKHGQRCRLAALLARFPVTPS